MQFQLQNDSAETTNDGSACGAGKDITAGPPLDTHHL